MTILFGGTSFIAEEFCAAGSPEYAAKIGVDHCKSNTREAFTFVEIQELLQKDNPEYYERLKSDWDSGVFNIILGMQ